MTNSKNKPGSAGILPASLRIEKEAAPPKHVSRFTLSLLFLCLPALFPEARADTVQASSSHCTVDTRDVRLGIGGETQTNSAHFTVDTRDVRTDLGGTGQAGSSHFMVDTRDVRPGLGGLAEAGSSHFTVDTTGLFLALTIANSGHFIVDTRDAIDFGLRLFENLATVRIAGEVPGSGGTLTSPLRIHKNGATYGILLTATNAPNATRIRVQTPAGEKAWLKLP